MSHTPTTDSSDVETATTDSSYAKGCNAKMPSQAAASSLVDSFQTEGRDANAEGITLLGNAGTQYASDYDPSLLETFENKHADHDYMVTFRCPEFTTLCPITGQPDFATLYINYIPQVRMVESKSLKLYLFSFRNHGDFHEDVVNVIKDDLVELMEPKYLEVRGMFYPRGGISIYPFANWAHPRFGYQDIAQRRLFKQLSDLDRGDGAR